jgi:hypothetical protein
VLQIDMYGEKTNIRSFRYSDEVDTALQSSDGSNLNEKFGNLVRKCYFDLPKRQDELKGVQKQIDDKRKEYWDLVKQLEKVHNLIQTLQTLERYGEMATKVAKDISEGKK